MEASRSVDFDEDIEFDTAGKVCFPESLFRQKCFKENCVIRIMLSFVVRGVGRVCVFTASMTAFTLRVAANNLSIIF